MRFTSIAFAAAVAVFAQGPAVSDVVIDVSRDGIVENLSPPQPLADAIYQALLTSNRSSQNAPAEHWYAVFSAPNWIYARFAPAAKLDIDGRRRIVSEILMSLPTTERGRRWPDYILLRTDIGVLSRAKWSACEMHAIVELARFDPSTQDPIYDTYCAAERRPEGNTPTP
jgi:hypothetical protein